MSIKLKEFHVKNDYYVKVQELNSKEFVGCTVKFPQNVLKKNKIYEKKRIYMINKDYLSVDIFTVSNNETSHRTIETLPYESRFFVIVDIVLQAYILNISPELIIIVNTDNNILNKKMVDIIQIDMSNKHRMFESKLLHSFGQVVNNNIDMNNVDINIIESVKKLQDFISDGGF